MLSFLPFSIKFSYCTLNTNFFFFKVLGISKQLLLCSLLSHLSDQASMYIIPILHNKFQLILFLNSFEKAIGMLN